MFGNGCDVEENLVEVAERKRVRREALPDILLPQNCSLRGYGIVRVTEASRRICSYVFL
jgi:hypothetical protein